MRKTLFMIACLLISGVTFLSCGSQDERLQKEVNKVLQEYGSIQGSVKDGVVTLEGTAKTEDEKDNAEGAVGSIAHVKSIVNNVVAEEQPINEETEKEADIEAQVDAEMNEEE